MLREHILLITFNKTEAANVQQMLEQSGYSASVITSNENDIINEIEKAKPDLVLMDITMEGNLFGVKTANEICKKINTPVVFIIASSGDLALKRSTIGDGYSCLAKPFNERELHDAVQVSIYKKKMANKLAESEQWYSTILKSIDEVVIIANIDRQITFMNPAAETLTGWKHEEAYEKDLAEVVILNHESTQYFPNTSATSVIWKGAINGINAGLSSAFILKSKDGTETAIEYSSSLIRNNNDEIIGVIFIFRDVTEKRQIADLKEKMYEQQLIQADKMISLGTLVAGVAHEINNPNNFIMLNTPILQDAWNDIMPILERYYEENDDFNIGGFKFTEMRNYIPKLFSGIYEGANRIKRIVSDLKDFARQEPVDMNQFVDVNFVVKSAITLVSNQIKKATKNFSVKYDENLPKIKGDNQRLEQVIINLVLNACQSLQNPKKSIHVSVCYVSANHQIVVKIKDEGVGIPRDIAARIFDPFFTTKRDSGGTGLGLSVSSGIVKDHGGSLKFTSTEDKGTTVIIELPVLDGAGEEGR